MIENKQNNPTTPAIKTNDSTHDDSQPESHEYTSTNTPPEYKQKKGGNFVLEVLKIVLLAIIIVVPFRIYIAQPFIVSGASMDNTFVNGQYLIVDQLSYRFDEPKRGDVIIFRFPLEPSKFFIKRVIGLPHDTVILQGKTTTIVNKENPDGMILDEKYLSQENVNNNPPTSTTLDDKEYFVMGDNRKESYDSRSWGVLNRKYIIGQAFVRLLPLTSFGIFPGQ